MLLIADGRRNPAIVVAIALSLACAACSDEPVVSPSKVIAAYEVLLPTRQMATPYGQKQDQGTTP